jgi:glycosyltransferase involved in cell wall biosynthesis
VYKGIQIAVVIPAYNEEKFMPGVITSVPDFVDWIEVVDDCSSDTTYDKAVEIAKKDPRVKIIKNQKNLGVGGATIVGYREILKSFPEAGIIVKIDGDGQMPVEYLAKLLDPLIEEGYHYAKGNRFLMGNTLEQMPKHRLLGNLALTLVTKFSSGYWDIFDSQNGFTAIKRECLEAIDLSRLHKRYFFENDILIHLNVHNFRVKDVPIPAIYSEEKSNIRITRVTMSFPFLFLHRYWLRLYNKYVLKNFSPIALFMISGSLLFGFGFTFSIYLWIKSLITNQPTPTGTIMLALVPIILGFQLILQAIVLDIQETPK